MAKRIGWLFCVASLAVAQGSSADGSPLVAVMTCAPAAGPGRVRCDAEVHVPADARIAWADVVITEAPRDVVPLKARLAPGDADAREVSWRWAFAVVAKTQGKGELKGRARAVVCRAEACAPATVDLSTVVSAGD